MRTPETAELTDHIALWFGPMAVVANVPVNRGERPRLSALRTNGMNDSDSSGVQMETGY